jgi:hypothetical protein
MTLGRLFPDSYPVPCRSEHPVITPDLKSRGEVAALYNWVTGMAECTLPVSKFAAYLFD